MAFISRTSRAGLAWLAVACGLLAAMVMHPSPSIAAEWSLLPAVRVAGGHESALIIDPGGAAQVIPGGGFFDLSPAISLTHGGSGGVEFEVGTRATLERFFNDENRTLYGQVLWVDYFRGLGSNSRARLSASGVYFDDSEQDTLRRISGGLEAGISRSSANWLVEGFAAGRRVRYPNVSITDASGNSSSYAETRWSGGGLGSMALGRSAAVRVGLTGQATSSADPDFESMAMVADASVVWSAWSRTAVRAGYSRQDRRFVNRADGADSDDYQQWGIGVSHRFSSGVGVSVRWSEGRYTDTDGAQSPTDRFEVAVDFGPSVFGVSDPAPVVSELPEDLRSVVSGPAVGADGEVLFRIFAPDATSVSVAGDFTGWGRAPLELSREEGGWWELRSKLAPGQYQYVYLIDGVAVTPPESARLIDDGFGTRNGYLEIAQ